MSHKTTTEEGGNIIIEALPYGFDRLPEHLSNLRKKLYIKAKQEPRFRFYVLYDRIYRKDVLAAAWQQVASNKGAPGVDGVSIEDIQNSSEGVEGFLAGIHEDLKHKSYKPQAVCRVMIPKANPTLRVILR